MIFTKQRFKPKRYDHANCVVITRSVSLSGRPARLKSLFYLLLAGGGEELVAAGGASITPTRANASIAIFQVPLSPFSILNQLPWMVLSLTVIE
jgi:hypothetical protein